MVDTFVRQCRQRPHTAILLHHPRVRNLVANALSRLWLAIPLLALPALWSFKSVGLPASADGEIHLLRSVELGNHIQHGILLPRWVPELALGNGFPVFNFYGPGSYYLVEGLQFAGLDYSLAFQAAFCLLVIAAGLGMYGLARDIFGKERPWIALVAATAYMYAPYLLTNVFIRGALAEVAAQALLPWIFWALRRLILAPSPVVYLLPATVSMGALALTHNITLILAPLMLIGYAAVLWWQAGRKPEPLRWLIISVILAGGISVFFWAPLIAERGFLTDDSYKLAATVFMPENPWHWRDFLDLNFRFDYTFSIPFQLGLVQLLLALAGVAAVIRHRDAEWYFWIIAAVVSAALIGEWALPFWLSSPLLLVVQFPWRMLALLSVPLALFTGAALLAIRPARWQVLAAGLLLALIVAANTPEIGWMKTLGTDYRRLGVAQIGRYESSTNSPGINATGELWPRWVKRDTMTLAPGSQAASIDMIMQAASAFGVRAAVKSAVGGPLRFTTYYFPGWEARLDGSVLLPTYPSTNLGLLTIDLPPGSHELTVTWAGTPVQHLATALSLLALGGLAWLCWRYGRPRWLCGLPLLALCLGIYAAYWPRPMDKIQTTDQPVELPGVQLLGFRSEQRESGYLDIYPYWYVSAQPARFRVHWLLADMAGQVLSEVDSQPYFNSVQASNWPAGTLVDDAYQLALPPGLSTGSYELRAQMMPENNAWKAQAPQVVGHVILREPVATGAGAQPASMTDTRFGDQVMLEGYDLAVNHQKQPATSGRPVFVHAGDVLEYTLYWRAAAMVVKDYNSYIHVVDVMDNSLVKQDKLASAPFSVSTSWDPFHLQPDVLRLVIPAGTPSGVYWPQVGAYESTPFRLLAATDKNGQPVGDHVRLAPIKVIGDQAGMPEYPMSVRIGDVASLLGYDLTPAEASVRPGGTFTVTLYYRAEQPTARSYTRFAHFGNGGDMVAQGDSMPQLGGNPTWTWAPGEIITDTQPLTVTAQAGAGTYRLSVGFYDPEAGGARLPVKDSRGQVLPDGEVVLTELEVKK